MSAWRAYDQWEARDRTLLEAANARREHLDTLLADHPLTLDEALTVLEARYHPPSPDAEDA